MQGTKIDKDSLYSLLAKIDTEEIYIYSNKKWDYPNTGDDQKTCMMLDMNFQVEQKAGIVIHIPFKVLEDYK